MPGCPLRIQFAARNPKRALRYLAQPSDSKIPVADNPVYQDLGEDVIDLFYRGEIGSPVTIVGDYE